MSITITQVRNATSLQYDNLRMDVEINHPQYGWIPYTVEPADTDTTINNADILALVGNVFTAYTAPTQEELDAILAGELRNERNQLLLAVDALAGNALRWSELSPTEQTEVSNYRLELLDVPQQSGFPTTVVWPNKE